MNQPLSPLQRAAQFVNDEIWSVLPASYSLRTLRLASVVWGGALLLLACWMAWRQARQGEPLGMMPWLVAGLGVAVAAALLTPRLDHWFFSWAVRLFAIIGFVISTVLMTLSFYLVVTPLGALLRLMGKDPLRIGPRAAPAWIERKTQPDRRRFFRMY